MSALISSSRLSVRSRLSLADCKSSLRCAQMRLISAALAMPRDSNRENQTTAATPAAIMAQSSRILSPILNGQFTSFHLTYDLCVVAVGWVQGDRHELSVDCGLDAGILRNPINYINKVACVSYDCL